MKNEFFDKAVQEKALDHQAAVPADAWDNIQKNKRKRRFGIFWWALPLLLAGFGVFGVYLYQQNRQADTENNLVTKDQGNKYKTGTGDTGEMIAVPDLKNNQAGIDSGNDLQVSNRPVTEHTATTVMTGADNKTVGKIDNNDVNGSNMKMGPANKPVYVSVNKKKKRKADIEIQNNDADSDIETSVKNKKRLIKKQNWKTGNDIQNDHTDRGKEISVNNRNRLIKKKIHINTKVNNDVDVTTAQGAKRKYTKARAKMTITPAIAAGEESEDNGMVAAKTPAEEQETNSLVPQEDTAVIEASVSVKEKKDNTPPLVVLTKKDDQKKAKVKTLFIDISTSGFIPLQNNQKLAGIERTTIGTDHKTVFKADSIFTKTDPSIAFSISLRKSFNKKWSFSAGLQYARVKETVRLSGKETTTKYNYIKRLDPSGLTLIDDTVQVHTEGIRIIDAVNSYDFLTIPLAVQYTFYERNKWSINFNGGIYLNVRSYYKNSIQGNLEHQYTSGKTGTSKANNKVTADIYTGLRFTRIIGSNIHLFAEPFLQLNFMKYNMPGMINNKNIHRAGINIGFAYSLNY